MRFLYTLFILLLISPMSYANSGDLVFSTDELASFDFVDEQEINPEKSLSENFENTKENNPTWLEEFAKEGIPTLKSDSNKKDELPMLEEDFNSDDKQTIQSIIEQKKASPNKIKSSNASVFDISGVMLRMDILQAEEALRKRGYKKISQDLQIPNFIKWRNEEKCRNSGVVGYERLASCVNNLSKDEKAQYVQKGVYKNTTSKEEVQVFLTSNFTGNKVYKVLYSTEVPTIKGSSQKSQYLRNIKIYEFWRKINQKYGNPDDKEAITWGMGINKPSLTAKTGLLVLEDPMLLELDWTRMSREDQKYLNTDLYNF